MANDSKRFPSVDLSPETICGTVIDTQEALILGVAPNEAQATACKLANAAASTLKHLSDLIDAVDGFAMTLAGTQEREAAKELLYRVLDSSRSMRDSLGSARYHGEA